MAALLAGRTIAVAESCTGGLMAARLTDRAGSSAYFAGGVVAYSNEAKVELVGVDPALIERFGAVSTEVAEALADGAMTRFGADIGVGITGIAGPDGGTEEKPVGLGVLLGQRARRASGSPAAPGFRATAPTSATARPRSRCTCCGGCSGARATSAVTPRPARVAERS